MTMQSASCPLCRQAVSIPRLDVLVERYELQTMEETVLRAVWMGGGRPVQTSRIFDAMYADDPEGGPEASQMYRAFNAALATVAERLKGAGVGIVSAGYRKGYRIVMETR